MHDTTTAYLPKRVMGQHYLINRGIARRIARFVLNGEPEEAILEIGPGKGALTRWLVTGAKTYIGVELERSSYENLSKIYGKQQGIHLIRGDILKQDFGKLTVEHGVERFVVAGNIPYRITTPLLFHLVHERQYVARAILTIQREVAERLTIGAGSRSYGLLSATFGLYGEARILMNIPPEAFHPRPRVHSSVVEITFTDKHLKNLCNEEIYNGLVRSAFGQKRKMVKNSLRDFLQDKIAAPGDINRLFEKAGINPECRAESIPVEGYVTIANLLEDTTT